VEINGDELIMGWQEVALIIESPLFKGPEKAVLIALAHHINHDRFIASGDTEVWPAYPTLVEYSGWSESTVQRTLIKLEADGIIKCTFKGVGKQSSRYTIEMTRVVTEPTQDVGQTWSTPGSESESRVGGATTQSSQRVSGVVREPTQSSQSDYQTEKITENLTSKKKVTFEAAAYDSTSFLKVKDSVNPETPTASVREDMMSEMEIKATLAEIYELCKGVTITRDDVSAMKAYEVRDPIKLAHQLVWAYTKSNHWPKKLNGLRSFINNLSLIRGQYEKFYSVPRSEGKKIPETICPTLPSVLAWRRKAAKLSKATDMISVKDVTLDEL